MQVLDLSFRRPPRWRCRVSIGAGVVLALEEDLVREAAGRLVAVVSDSNVAPLHAQPLCERLVRRGLRTTLLPFAAGESSKSRATKSHLEDRLVGSGAGRDTLVLAVGGGVTCDLAGFVASTWHRGVPVIQLPTSLLAMVDAAVGGKTGVNLPEGKNLVGAFHQPSGVYADVALLDTLPEAEFVGGLAEVVKSAVIGDAAFFRWLESSVDLLLGREPLALERAVTRCIRIKARVVVRDERESGRRAILNFGHTVAHALESASCYRESHGRAVAAGMCVEARLAREVTGFPEPDLRRLERLLDAFGLPIHLPEGVEVDSLIASIHRDKKARGGRARFALPARLGRMLPGDDVTVVVAEGRLLEALLRPAAGP